MTGAIMDLSVSLQCLVKLWRKYGGSYGKTAEGQFCHWSQPTQYSPGNVLLNSRSFYDTYIHLAEQGKPADVIIEDFIRAFDTVSHSALLDRMSCIWLDRNRTWWVSCWPVGQAQRITVNGFHRADRWSLSGLPRAPF